MRRRLNDSERAEYKAIHGAYNLYVNLEIDSINKGRPRNSHIKLLALRANTIMDKNELRIKAYGMA